MSKLVADSRQWVGGALLLLPLATTPIFDDHKFETIASWYGPGFDGHRTASGQTFNEDAMTAASRDLPFGTKVRVENMRNGRQCTVVINDRGPFVPGRRIDLSHAAATQLGIGGTAPVLCDAYTGGGNNLPWKEQKQILKYQKQMEDDRSRIDRDNARRMIVSEKKRQRHAPPAQEEQPSVANNNPTLITSAQPEPVPLERTSNSAGTEASSVVIQRTSNAVAQPQREPQSKPASENAPLIVESHEPIIFVTPITQQQIAVTHEQNTPQTSPTRPVQSPLTQPAELPHQPVLQASSSWPSFPRGRLLRPISDINKPTIIAATQPVTINFKSPPNYSVTTNAPVHPVTAPQAVLAPAAGSSKRTQTDSSTRYATRKTRYTYVTSSRRSRYRYHHRSDQEIASAAGHATYKVASVCEKVTKSLLAKL